MHGLSSSPATYKFKCHFHQFYQRMYSTKWGSKTKCKSVIVAWVPSTHNIIYFCGAWLLDAYLYSPHIFLRMRIQLEMEKYRKMIYDHPFHKKWHDCLALVRPWNSSPCILEYRCNIPVPKCKYSWLYALCSAHNISLLKIACRCHPWAAILLLWN
jgi:hypothetical protein